jgi:hypothetical protein
MWRVALAIAAALVLGAVAGCSSFNKGLTKATIQRAESRKWEIRYAGESKYVLTDERLKEVDFTGSVKVEDVNVHYQNGLEAQAARIADKTSELLCAVEERTGVNVAHRTSIYLLRVDDIPSRFDIKLKTEPNAFHLPLFVKAGSESCRSIIAENWSYPYALVHELVETSLVCPVSGACVLPDLSWQWFLVKGQVNNYTRWFRDGLANYGGYIAYENVRRDEEFATDDISQLTKRRLHSQPFSSLSRLGKKLFGWHQHYDREQSIDYYNAALGLFLLIEHRFGQESVPEIMLQVNKRNYLNGSELVKIVNQVLGVDIVQLAEDFCFPETGLELKVLSRALVANEGLDVDEGLFVSEVEPNSVGDAAGFQKGDVVLRVNDGAVGNNLDYELALFELLEHETAEIALWRQEQGKLTITLPLATER